MASASVTRRVLSVIGTVKGVYRAGLRSFPASFPQVDKAVIGVETHGSDRSNTNEREEPRTRLVAHGTASHRRAGCQPVLSVGQQDVNCAQ